MPGDGLTHGPPATKTQAAVTTDPMGWRMVKRGRIWIAKPTRLRRTKMIKLDRTDAPAAAEHATVYLALN
jgi:hypothetical protein